MTQRVIALAQSNSEGTLKQMLSSPQLALLMTGTHSVQLHTVGVAGAHAHSGLGPVRIVACQLLRGLGQAGVGLVLLFF